MDDIIMWIKFYELEKCSTHMYSIVSNPRSTHRLLLAQSHIHNIVEKINIIKMLSHTIIHTVPLHMHMYMYMYYV